jgi:hypothetical protein
MNFFFKIRTFNHCMRQVRFGEIQDVSSHIFATSVRSRGYEHNGASVTRLSAGILPTWSTDCRSCFGTGGFK